MPKSAFSAIFLKHVQKSVKKVSSLFGQSVYFQRSENKFKWTLEHHIYHICISLFSNLWANEEAVRNLKMWQGCVCSKSCKNLLPFQAMIQQEYQWFMDSRKVSDMDHKLFVKINQSKGDFLDPLVDWTQRVGLAIWQFCGI